VSDPRARPETWLELDRAIGPNVFLVNDFAEV